MAITTYTETWHPADLPAAVERAVIASVYTAAVSTTVPTTGQLWPRITQR